MHTSGMSLYQMLPPVILFSFINYLLASFIAIYAVPTGNMVYKDTLIKIAKSTANMAIKERVFFEPFQKFVKGDLQTLPRRYTKGTFTVKVSLKNCWRTIVVSSEHTLEELHEAIQDAFAFDRDHLYAFFTDGKPWSNAHVYAPEVNEGPFSDQISIGDLGLYPGQLFLYIFDFGDEWQFKIEILDFNSEPGPPTPVILERKGKSPEQYPLHD